MKKILLLLSLISMMFAIGFSASAVEEKVVIDNVVYELKDHYRHMLNDNYGLHYAVTDFFEDETLAETTTKITIVDKIDGIKVVGVDTNDIDSDYDGIARDNNDEYPSVKEVVLPTTIKYLGRFALSCFPSVEEILLPAELDNLNIGTFAYMDSLKSITLPGGITYIGNRAFLHCYNLEKVVFQGDVTEIDRYAFCGCNKLTSINFPATLKNIRKGAFAGTAFKKIVLPAGVDTHDSFYGCSNLKNVVYLGTKPVKTLEIDDFSDCKNLKNIYLRGVATKKIKFGYLGYLFKDRYIKNIYFEGSEELWNKLTQKEERASLKEKNVHIGFYYKHQHNFVIDGEPTCKKSGTFNCKCICGDSYKVTLPKNPNNHKFGGWKVTKEATCAVMGLRKRTCKTCGYVQQAKIRKDFLGTVLYREEKVFSDSIEFNWKAAQNATGYNVYLKDEAKKEAVLIDTIKDGKAETYTFKNLESGKYYIYEIEAYNVDKFGNVAKSERAVLSATTVGTQPKNLKATSTQAGVVELTWDSSGEDVSYDIYCGSDKEVKWKEYYSKTNKKTIKNLKSGETYSVYVEIWGGYDYENERHMRLISETVEVVVK